MRCLPISECCCLVTVLMPRADGCTHSGALAYALGTPFASLGRGHVSGRPPPRARAPRAPALATRSHCWSATAHLPRRVHAATPSASRACGDARLQESPLAGCPAEQRPNPEPPVPESGHSLAPALRRPFRAAPDGPPLQSSRAPCRARRRAPFARANSSPTRCWAGASSLSTCCTRVAPPSPRCGLRVACKDAGAVRQRRSSGARLRARPAPPPASAPACGDAHCSAAPGQPITGRGRLLSRPQPARGPPALPDRASVQTEVREKLATMYDAKNVDAISVFGFRTQVRA